jgi:hypothetical protein
MLVLVEICLKLEAKILFEKFSAEMELCKIDPWSRLGCELLECGYGVVVAW